jgi:hypothetical protein
MLGILFAQFSLMSYACPKEGGAAEAAATAPMAECDGMAISNPDANLCELHCQDVVKLAVPASGEVPLLLVAYPVAPLAVAPTASPAQRPSDRPSALAAAPPLAIQFCRFLI